LAFEVTRLVHGEPAARAAQEAAHVLFSGKGHLGSSTKQLGSFADTTGGFVVAPEAMAEPALASGLAGGLAEAMVPMVPTVEIDAAALEQGIAAERLFVLAGLARSLGEARRLIEQGGAYIWGERIGAPDRRTMRHPHRPPQQQSHQQPPQQSHDMAHSPRMVTTADLRDGALLLRAGKKRYRRIVAKH